MNYLKPLNLDLWLLGDFIPPHYFFAFLPSLSNLSPSFLSLSHTSSSSYTPPGCSSPRGFKHALLSDWMPFFLPHATNLFLTNYYSSSSLLHTISSKKFIWSRSDSICFCLWIPSYMLSSDVCWALGIRHFNELEYMVAPVIFGLYCRVIWLNHFLVQSQISVSLSNLCGLSTFPGEDSCRLLLQG